MYSYRSLNRVQEFFQNDPGLPASCTRKNSEVLCNSEDIDLTNADACQKLPGCTYTAAVAATDDTNQAIPATCTNACTGLNKEDCSANEACTFNAAGPSLTPFSKTSCSDPPDDRLDACNKDDRLSKMNAKSACEAIKERETNIWDAVQSIGTTLASPGAALIKAFGAGSTEHQKIANKINLDIDTKTLVDQASKCENLIRSEQTNVIKAGGPQCIEEIRKLNLPADITAKLIKELRQEISNVTQTTIADLSQTCQLDQMSDALTKMQASIDNSALQNAINKAKGIGARVDGEEDTCNDIDVDSSACKYMTQKQCCSNQVTNVQSNTIDLGCLASAHDVTQTANATTYQSCTSSNAAKVSDDLTSSLKNASSQSATQTAISFDPTLLALLALGALFLMGGGPLMMSGSSPSSKRSSSRIAYVLGSILLIAGVAILILFFTYRLGDPEKTPEKSLLNCPGTKQLKDFGPDLEISFEDARKRATEKDGVVAFDFFSPSPNPSDDEIGHAIYYSVVDRDKVDVGDGCGTPAARVEIPAKCDAIDDSNEEAKDACAAVANLDTKTACLDVRETNDECAKVADLDTEDACVAAGCEYTAGDGDNDATCLPKSRCAYSARVPGSEFSTSMIKKTRGSTWWEVGGIVACVGGVAALIAGFALDPGEARVAPTKMDS